MGPNADASPRPLWRCAPRASRRWLLAWLLLHLATPLAAAAEIELPIADKRKPISVQAQAARQWRKGEYQVWLLSGEVTIRQGAAVTRSQEAVLWVDRRPRYSAHPSLVIAYLEGGVRLDFGHGGPPHRVSGQSAQSLQDDSWFGRFYTIDDIEIDAPILGGEPSVKPAVFEQGVKARDPQVQPAQFATAAPAGPVATARSLNVVPRDSVGIELDIRNSQELGEAVAIISSGVRVIIDDVVIRNGAAQSTALGKIEMETDRLVAWTRNIQDLAAAVGGQSALQASNTPLEFYLEGNIVFRQGDSVIYAERMYYNALQQYGVVLDAEMLAAAPEYGGLIRLKAQLLQATGRRSFEAYNAAITTSRMGEPKYWLQFGELSLRDEPQPAVDPAGRPLFDRVTDEPLTEHNYRATARNTAVYLGGLPVFYWPVFSTDLTQSSFYLENFKVKNDSIFGTQVYTDWNLYHLFGFRNPPEGTKWTLSGDYLSERGPAVGTNFRYDRDRFLFLPGPTLGELDAWGIYDTGLDNLGRDRPALVPEEEYRGRVLWRHRQRLANDWMVTGELGWISDRNFLEQYFEQEWDTGKDEITGLEIKKYFNHHSFSITGDVRLNDFFTQSEWTPRLDHFFFGQQLGWLSWHGHTSVGYGRLRVADPPQDPVDAAKFQLLAWEREAEGLRAVTRQEIELPVMAGPIKLAPFVGGEIGYWGEDLTGSELTRMTGQAGVRASLPMTAVNPRVRSELFNLNGLAHKIEWRSELFYADSDQNVDQFPLYDPLDDDAIEHFRRRFYFDTFGGVPGGNIPLPFDERYFAVRSGLQRWVASPSMEIADDLLVSQVGVHQRLQTKRGSPGNERIVDWMVFDVEGSLFPEEERDNFGALAGLVNYDFRWHLGDRFTLLSDGYFDFFTDGLRTYTAGALVSRPERSNAYLGYRGVVGPFRSDILLASMDYRMSSKWILTASGSYDFGPTGNIGQTLAVTRIGESVLMQIGVRSDTGRDNVTAVFSIEPRFLPGGRLGRVGGVRIPPTGVAGLE